MPFVMEVANVWLLPLYPGAKKKLVRLAANLSLAKGTILGELTARPGTFAPYSAGNQDGTQTARAILEVDCATDEAGRITIASRTTGGGPLWDREYDRVHVYEAGSFACGDLVGLDAQAVTQLGRLVEGTVANGVLRMP